MTSDNRKFPWIFSNHTEEIQNTMLSDDIQYTVHQYCSLYHFITVSVKTFLCHNLLMYNHVYLYCIILCYIKYVCLYCIAITLWNFLTSTRHTYTCIISRFTSNPVTRNLKQNVQFGSSLFSIAVAVCVCQCTCH